MRFRYQVALGTLLLLLLGFMTHIGFAQSQPSPDLPSHEVTSILLENVRIFDGTSEQLSAPSNVLVVGNKIQTISTESISVPAETSVTRIAGEGQVLMPGLIDAHTHLFMESTPVEELLSPDIPVESLFEQAQTNATEMLMRGFTSARDMAGPVFELTGLKRF